MLYLFIELLRLVNLHINFLWKNVIFSSPLFFSYMLWNIHFNMHRNLILSKCTNKFCVVYYLSMKFIRSVKWTQTFLFFNLEMLIHVCTIKQASFSKLSHASLLKRTEYIWLSKVFFIFNTHRNLKVCTHYLFILTCENFVSWLWFPGFKFKIWLLTFLYYYVYWSDLCT